MGGQQAGDTGPIPMRWWWGTNRPGGVYYAGRVHIVAPEDPATGVCDLPGTAGPCPRRTSTGLGGGR